jgi:hypothetical protein
MADITSGWFALGGALLGGAISQVTPIISTVSKSRARKRKAAQATVAEKAARQRPLYERLIYDLDQAAEYIAWVARTLHTPGKGPAGGRRGLQGKLTPLRAMAVSVQIDGSDRAKIIATSVLNGTSQLWQQATEDSELTDHALAAAHDAVVKAHGDMIDASREDFGANAS